MGFSFKGCRNETTDSVGLLISILVRYPEVSTINFDPGEQILKFTFIYSQVLGDHELASLKGKLTDSIDAYNMLEGKEIRMVAINHNVCDNLTMIEVQRDVHSLAQEEINLIVELFRQSLNSSLVTEEDESLVEEEMMAQDEIIEHMLECIKGSAEKKQLYAFREEGRVLVFNK
jgi:hypothetical protein